MNQMKTVLTGGTRGKNGYKDNSNLQKFSERRVTDHKDWYQRYFKDLQQYFELRLDAYSMCMAKVNQMLNAKMNGVNLGGKREAYAAVIMKLVAEELQLPIKMEEIKRSQSAVREVLLNSEIDNAGKKLRKVFKEWFRNNNTPQILIQKYGEKMNWPEDLKEDCLYIYKKIKEPLDGCQPMTIVGVAMILLNSRLDMPQRAAQYSKHKQ